MALLGHYASAILAVHHQCLRAKNTLLAAVHCMHRCASAARIDNAKTREAQAVAEDVPRAGWWSSQLCLEVVVVVTRKMRARAAGTRKWFPIDTGGEARPQPPAAERPALYYIQFRNRKGLVHEGAAAAAAERSARLSRRHALDFLRPGELPQHLRSVQRIAGQRVAGDGLSAVIFTVPRLTCAKTRLGARVRASHKQRYE